MCSLPKTHKVMFLNNLEFINTLKYTTNPAPTKLFKMWLNSEHSLALSLSPTCSLIDALFLAFS